MILSDFYKLLPLLQCDCSIGQFESLGDGFDDDGQDRVRGESHFQSLAEAGEDGVGVIAVTVVSV